MPSFRQIPCERSSAASNRLTARCSSRILHSFSIVCRFAYGLFAAVPDTFAAFDTFLRVDCRKPEPRLGDRPDGTDQKQRAPVVLRAAEIVYGECHACLLVEQYLVDSFLERRLGQGTLCDLGLTAGGDEKQRRDRADAKCGGELLLLFGIHLVDVDAVAVLGSQLFQNRGKRLAGAAPRCIEVYERRFVAEVLPRGRVRFVICDFGQEIRLGQCDRFHGILFFSVVFLVAAVCAGCQAEHAHRGQ